jgi:hypothetical protein
VGKNDIFYVNWTGGGGVRDPLERDPGAVCRDVAEGVVSTESARNLYGVAILPDGSSDLERTQSLRHAMRAQRTEAAEPLPMGGHNRHTCARCAAGQRPGRFAVRQRRLSAIDASYTTGSEAMLAELLCLQCGTLLDSEVTQAGVEPMFDAAQLEDGK